MRAEDWVGVSGESWTGTADANTITGIAKPRVLAVHEWSERDWRNQRAEVMTLLHGELCSHRDALTTPVELPDQWWTNLRSHPLSDRVTAVGCHDGTSHKRRRIREQPAHDRRDLLGLRDATLGSRICHRGQVRRILQPASENLGPDGSGSEDVDSDALACVVEGNGLAEPDDSVLACTVGADAWSRDEATHGRGVENDSSAGTQHRGNLVTKAPQSAEKVDVDHSLGLSRVDLVQRQRVGLDAGVVERQVQSAELSLDPLDTTSHRVVAGDVQPEGKRLAAIGDDLLGVLRDQGDITRRQDDGGATLSEMGGGSGADAAAGTGDQTDPVPQVCEAHIRNGHDRASPLRPVAISASALCMGVRTALRTHDA